MRGYSWHKVPLKDELLTFKYVYKKLLAMVEKNVSDVQ